MQVIKHLPALINQIDIKRLLNEVIHVDDIIKLILEQLKKRNMNGYFSNDRKDAVSQALQLIPSGSTVGFGGSVTLEQIGILDTLRSSHDIKLLDRTQLSSASDIRNLYLKMYCSDIFLSSTNAIIKNNAAVQSFKTNLQVAIGKSNTPSMIKFSGSLPVVYFSILLKICLSFCFWGSPCCSYHIKELRILQPISILSLTI